MKDKIIVTGGIVGVQQLDAQGGGERRPGWVHVDELQPVQREGLQQCCDYAAHHAGTHDGDAVTQSAVPRPRAR